MQDYNINDAFKDGFECGLLYMIRYMVEVEGRRMTDAEVIRLSEHLAMKKQWRPSEDWALMVHNEVERGTSRNLHSL